MELKYNRAGIVVKPHKKVVFYLKKALEILKKLGVEVALEKYAADIIGLSSNIPREKIAQYSDIIILIGGDGTFLSVAAQAVEQQIPVGGFNLGTLGFLTELNKEELEENLLEIFQGNAKLTERILLELHFQGSRYLALNDVVASKGTIARIINLQLEVDDEYVAEIKGDGLIVATPTGSTAYSLSSGGPILTPKVNGIVITPICPHSLTFRPFIIPDNSEVKVTLISENTEVFITVDGQKVIPMSVKDKFSVRKSGKNLKMVTARNMNYFKLINEKLNWGL